MLAIFCRLHRPFLIEVLPVSEPQPEARGEKFMYLQSNLRSDVALSVGTFTYTEILQQPRLWPTTLEIARASGWGRDRPDRPTLITGAEKLIGLCGFSHCIGVAECNGRPDFPRTSLH